MSSRVERFQEIAKKLHTANWKFPFPSLKRSLKVLLWHWHDFWFFFNGCIGCRSTISYQHSLQGHYLDKIIVQNLKFTSGFMVCHLQTHVCGVQRQLFQYRLSLLSWFCIHRFDPTWVSQTPTEPNSSPPEATGGNYSFAWDTSGRSSVALGGCHHLHRPVNSHWRP